MDIDRDALYQRVFEGLLKAIRDGTYPAGSRLPSASALREELGVSRSTIVRVTERLRWFGLIVGPAGGIVRVASEPRRTAALELMAQAEAVRRLPE